ncbi:hypothetical protein ACFVH0_10280 [Streptomyces sp. NPDC127117]|uniref:hypothetical protein n=1 Tax=Streptomyces sp. NPDC127117 TaxID=3345368 RepID=UPI00362AE33B
MVKPGRAGAVVVVNHSSARESAEDVVRETESFGVRAYAHRADVSREEQAVGMFARTAEESIRADAGMTLCPGSAAGG